MVSGNVISILNNYNSVNPDSISDNTKKLDKMEKFENILDEKSILNNESNRIKKGSDDKAGTTDEVSALVTIIIFQYMLDRSSHINTAMSPDDVNTAMSNRDSEDKNVLTTNVPIHDEAINQLLENILDKYHISETSNELHNNNELNIMSYIKDIQSKVADFSGEDINSILTIISAKQNDFFKYNDFNRIYGLLNSIEIPKDMPMSDFIKKVSSANDYVFSSDFNTDSNEETIQDRALILSGDNESEDITEKKPITFRLRFQDYKKDHNREVNNKPVLNERKADEFYIPSKSPKVLFENVKSFSKSSSVTNSITSTFTRLMDDLAGKAVVLLNNNNRSQVDIQLKPEYLGKVSLRVVLEDGILSARITTQSNDIKSFIESHLDDLKSVLKNQGYDCERLDVDVGQQNKQSDFFYNNRNNVKYYNSGMLSKNIENDEDFQNNIQFYSLRNYVKQMESIGGVNYLV